MRPLLEWLETSDLPKVPLFLGAHALAFFLMLPYGDPLSVIICTALTGWLLVPAVGLLYMLGAATLIISLRLLAACRSIAAALRTPGPAAH